MENITFKGDLNGLSENQLNFIKTVLEEKGFIHAKVQISNFDEASAALTATIKRVVVEKDKEELKMIAKIASKTKQFRDRTQTVGIFNKETVFYGEILPKFSELEGEAGIASDERFQFPIFYGSYSEEPDEMILLEDLNSSGYTTFDRLQPLPSNALEIALNHIAKYHAFSFVIKHKDPEAYITMKSKLPNIFVSVDSYDVYLAGVENAMVELVDELKYKEAIKGSLANNVHVELRKSVIIHGDFKTSNILFKLQEGEPKDCCLIDFQMSLENSPVLDLFTLLFNCTDYNTRQNLQEWLDFYHDQLDRHLKNYGLEANMIYSKDEFMLDMKRYGRKAFGGAVITNMFLLFDEEGAEAIKRALDGDCLMSDIFKTWKVIPEDETTTNMMKQRLMEIVDSFLEFGYI